MDTPKKKYFISTKDEDPYIPEGKWLMRMIMKYVYTPEGEWMDEPDHEIGEYKGFTYCLDRKVLGFWCGYVYVPNSYPLDEEKKESLDVHGGITYDEQDIPLTPWGDSNYEEITKKTSAFQNGHWIGFDCGHYMDKMPYLENPYPTESIRLMTLKGSYESYKNISFVRQECFNLIDQIEKEIPGD